MKTSDAFGPSARVELSPQKAVQAQSNNPSSGLYGADGRFVESAGRREITQTGRDDTPPAASGQTDKATDSRAEQTARAPRGNRDVKQALLRAATDVRSQSRDLSLAGFDAAVPPAAREELRALADRVNRRATTQSLEPRDYKRLSELLDRVGRFGDAKEALERAEKLEARNEPEPRPVEHEEDDPR